MEEVPGCSLNPQPDTSSSFLSKLEMGPIIGHGSFSSVRVARNKEDGKLYAVKKIQLDELDSNQFELIRGEVRKMILMKHPGLLPLECAPLSSTYCVMITPLMTLNSCEAMRPYYPSGISEPAVGLIIKDVLNALSYLHGKNIVHRTIKASHILVNEKGVVVLSGFRFVVQIPVNQSKITTSSEELKEMTKYLNWLSPEILIQDVAGYGPNSDMYSIGITCCELANGVVPYSEVSPSGMLIKKLEEPAPKLWDRDFLPSEEGLPSDAPRPAAMYPRDDPFRSKAHSTHFKNFVAVCVETEPGSRATCEQAMKSKFINSYKDLPASELLKHISYIRPVPTFTPEGGDAAQASTSSNKGERWSF